jgi:hypothetical protein
LTCNTVFIFPDEEMKKSDGPGHHWIKKNRSDISRWGPEGINAREIGTDQWLLYFEVFYLV